MIKDVFKCFHEQRYLVGLVFVRLACKRQIHTQTLTKEKALN